MDNQELMFKGDRLTLEDLGKIVNPFNEDEINKYDKLLNLKGLIQDITDYLEKFCAYILEGNAGAYDKNYEVIEKTEPVKRYHKKVPALKPVNDNGKIELEQTSDNDVWIDCTADTEGAVAYDYVYTRKELVEKNDIKKIRYDLLEGSEIFGKDIKNIIDLGLDLPPNLKALNNMNINDTIQNLLDLKEAFIDNPRFPDRLCIMLIDCMLYTDEKTTWKDAGGLDRIIKFIEENRKSFIDVNKFIKLLPQIKSQWKACYNAYEKTKNFGFSGYKQANESDLDKGYTTSYKDLMAKVDIYIE